MERKKTIRWDERQQKLNKILEAAKTGTGSYDCIVPVSGGKDGSYVAYQLKEKYDMNPLCVTIAPPLSLPLGDKNLNNFISSGYSHITINPSRSIMQKLDRYGFEELGFPYYGWLTAITTAPLQIAKKFGISLVFYAEDGEVEYGGANETQNTFEKSAEYAKNILLSNANSDALQSIGELKNGLQMFEFPESEDLALIKTTHWSYFEAWDPYRNYLVAKEKCGLEEAETTNTGTFTNFSQNDQALYALHTYLMYLKYGFGRANQDACIEIRRGAMDRAQAINLIRLYDGSYPEEHIESYLTYYNVDQETFNKIVSKWANVNLFESIGDGRFKPLFTIR
jgi:N-acetyl sugar amidotransferase